MPVSDEHSKNPADDILEAADVVAWKLSWAERRFIYVSPPAEDLLGYPTAAWHETGFWDRCHEPADADRVADVCTEAARSQGRRVIDHRMIRADGATVWVRATISPDTAADAPDMLLGTYVDVTDIKNSELHFQTLIQCHPSGVCVLDSTGEYVYANQMANRLLGIEPMSGPDCASWGEDAATPTNTVMERARVLARSLCSLSEEDWPACAHTARSRVRTSRGELIDVEYNLIPINWQGEPSLLILARDVTEELEASRGSTILRNQFEQTLLQTPIGVHLYHVQDGHAVLDSGNAVGDSLLHIEGSQLKGMCVEDVAPHLAETGLYETLVRIATEGGLWQDPEFDYESETLTGVFSVSVFRTTPGRAAVLFQDVTEHVRSKRRELEYQQRIRAMSAELSSAEDQERRRLAQELHDRVSQALAVATMNLDELATDGHDDARLATARRFVADAIREARSITSELYPPALHELGLSSALEWLCEQMWDSHGLVAEADIERLRTEPEPELSSILFRSARELLMNVVKHGSDRRVQLSLTEQSGELVLSVQDSGPGFDPADEAESLRGFGLFSIRERVDHIGGVFELESARGSSTRATIRVRTGE